MHKVIEDTLISILNYTFHLTAQSDKVSKLCLHCNNKGVYIVITHDFGVIFETAVHHAHHNWCMCLYHSYTYMNYYIFYH